MSNEQLQKIDALNRCTFLPGSYQKQFVRALYSRRNREDKVTEKQAAYLDKLYYMYRKQISQFWVSGMPLLVKPEDIVNTDNPTEWKRYENIFGLIVEVE